jgi:hypothetical protein
MVELILNYIMKFVLFGLVHYLVHSIFSKKTKNFRLSVDWNGLKIESSFYEE